MNILKAIAVYLDDSDKAEIELTWLHKTWILYCLDEEFDLVVYYNPSAKNRILKFEKIISIEMPYIRLAEKYKFLNSHYFCREEWREPLKKYKYLLKTDCDVFLTENIKGYVPSTFMVGQGGYYNQADFEKIEYIKKLSKYFGLHYNSMPGIGASFFGKTYDVLNIVDKQAYITEILITDYFKKEGCPFDAGVASMIAGEVIINGCFSNQHVSLYTLDGKCWENSKIGSDVIHIHAWHTKSRWSKHEYFAGSYNSWKVSLDDSFKNAANYCHWIATAEYSDIYSLRDKIREGEFKPNYELME